jgi:Ca2+/Na+ antiporter
MPEQIELISVLFLVVLALALLIERALEVLKAAYDIIDSKFDLYRFWTRRTRTTQQYIKNRLHVFEYVDIKSSAAIFNRFNELMLGPGNGYTGTVPMLCGDLVRAVWVRLACKIVGVALGIAGAFALRLDIVEAARSAQHQPTVIGMLLTGIAMGLGSGPVHKFIRLLEKKRSAHTQEVVTNA